MKFSCDKKNCQCDGITVYPLEVEEVNREACQRKTGTLVIVGQKRRNGRPYKSDGWLFVRCENAKLKE